MHILDELLKSMAESRPMLLQRADTIIDMYRRLGKLLPDAEVAELIESLGKLHADDILVQVKLLDHITERLNISRNQDELQRGLLESMIQQERLQDEAMSRAEERFAQRQRDTEDRLSDFKKEE